MNQINDQMTACFVAVRTWLAARMDRTETGASLVEYALLVALIAVVAVGAITLVGSNVSNKLNNVANAIGS